MSRAERVLDPDRSALHRFGAELRRWRKARGLSQDRLGALVHVSGDLIYRVELAERRPARDLAERCDQILGTEGALAELWEASDAEEAARRSAVMRLTDIRDVGSAERSDAGLAQLRSTAIALHQGALGWDGVSAVVGTEITAGTLDDDQGDELLTIACQTAEGRVILVAVPRRAFLAAGVGATIASVASQASASHSVAVRAARVQSVSDDALDRFSQIRRLLRDADNLFGPERVMPLVHEQIMLVRQLSAGARGADRRRLLTVQAQFADLYAWLRQDTGSYKEAQFWLDRALDWSQMAGHSEAAAFILARKSQVAGELRDATDAIDLAEVAIQRAQSRHWRAASVAATYAAYGYALQGDKASCERQYVMAHELLTKVEPDPSTCYGLFLSAAYIDVQRAHSMAVLGDNKSAARAFAEAIDALPSGYHRDRGIYLVRKAASHAGAEEPEEAAAAGMLALAIGTETNSSRIVDGLARLHRTLSPWREIPQVAEFSSALADHFADRPADKERS